MGCGTYKIFLNKADLIELQQYPKELHEKQNEQLSYWQEAWQREQESVRHSSMVDSCKSKMPCITMIDESLQLLCNEDMVTFWKDFEKK